MHAILDCMKTNSGLRSKHFFLSFSPLERGRPTTLTVHLVPVTSVFLGVGVGAWEDLSRSVHCPFEMDTGIEGSQ